MLRQRETISITYFAQFLSEIGSIISNIRKYVHQIIDISAPKVKEGSVKQSMSSVIMSTNKTFGELKAIQSLIAGYVKAHRLKIQKRSASQSHSTTYDSQHSKKSSFVKDWHKCSPLFQQQNHKNRSRSKGKNQKIKIYDTGKSKFIKDCILEDECNIKESENDHIKQSNTPLKTQKSEKWLSRIESLLGNMIEVNRSSLQKIIDKNKQCRNQVRILKSQIMGTC